MYNLKQYDHVLLWFEMKNTDDGLEVRIIKVNEQLKHLLPLALDCSDEGLKHWLKNRTIPRNRAYVSNFLSKLGLNERDTKGIMDICQGLSLNDSYWVVDASCTDTFAEKNLYTNSFNTMLASIAFTGFGSNTRSTFRSSPEFTTNGMLAKSWRRLKGEILLYKSGTEGFANSGLEPYSEYYACQVAERMELNYVPYTLSRWKKRLCSVCKLFTDIDTSYVPIGSLVRSGGMKAVLAYYKELGDEFYQQLVDMLVFDAIILNEDRHFGNFGVLVDNKENRILAPAPIYDNGLSLLCYATDRRLEDMEAYVNTRMPATYQSFVEYVKPLMTHRQREKVRRLLDFRFDRGGTYRLPRQRLEVLEQVVQGQARKLLE